MTPALGDAVARARGLVTHLLPEAVLDRLADSPGSAALAAALAQHGYAPAAAPGGVGMSSAQAVQVAIEWESARRLAVLARWLGDRRGLFACLFEDEERRVLRRLLRRAVSGASPTAPAPRTDALLSLSRRARESLARADDPAGIARTLERAGSAYGPPLARALREGGPALLALEGALDRTFAARALAAARRGGRELFAWVAQGIDLENAWSVLLGAEGEFLEGGPRLSRAQCERVGREPDASARRAWLAGRFAGTSLADVFADAGAPLASLERRARHARAAACERASRLDPLGPMAFLMLVLRLRDETARLRRIASSVAQGVPEPISSTAWEGVAS